jgi:hypothetical protein
MSGMPYVHCKVLDILSFCSVTKELSIPEILIKFHQPNRP